MKRSYVWAGVFALVLGGWLASGEFAKTSQDSIKVTEPEVKARDEKLFRVVTESFDSQMRQRVVTLRGRTEPHKTLEVLVRTAGIVERSKFHEGERVKAGDILCELDMSDRASRLARAQAEQASAKRDFEAAEKLAKRKFVSEAKLASELARLNAANASIEQIELDMKWTNVRAPINGTLSHRPAEEGRYLKVAEICARIVSLEPILAVGQLAEREIGTVKIGQPAQITLVTGQELEGTIRFIAPQGDVATRTFRVEIEAPNPGGKIRSGITSEINIPLTSVRAHLLPAALVSLDDKGVVGVYAVGNENKVEFRKITLLSLSREGAWVTGLDDRITLITVGQHYVLPGQTIEPVTADEAGFETGS